MTHELTISETSVKILQSEKLTDKSIMFVEVDVGNMPPKRIADYLASVKETIHPLVQPAHLVIIARKEDRAALQIKIIDSS